MPGCLDDDAALALAEGGLPEPARDAALRHLDACASCRRLVSALAATLGEASASPPEEPAPSTLLLRQGAVVGRFVVLGVVGVGGMGVVYSAYDPELDRKVALKVLARDPSADPRSGRPPPASSGEGARARVLAEAQAMARLMHPNVVAVHDLGTLGDQVFLAMEFVEGENLRLWLRRAPRSRREILDVLVQAGRGLAAAHAVGLVHRDFKPDNVLIAGAEREPASPRGRPSGLRAKVTDFGLATPLGERTADAVIAGTPAYMSPEQARGEPVDARSDQYSFALTLYEALHGRLPPKGSTPAALAPRGRFTLSPVQRVLSRALQPQREARFASMGALLDELAVAPRRRRRRALVTAAAALVVLVPSVLAYRDHAARGALCKETDAEIAGVYGPDKRAQIQSRLEQNARPFARGALPFVDATLSGYASAWSRESKEACEATRVRGEQPAEAMALRAACLSRRLDELRALTERLAAADPQTVEHAAAAVTKLTPIEACRSAEALAMQPMPPVDPRVRAQVQALRLRLGEVKAMLDAGTAEAALAKAAACVTTAEEIGYGPARAEAWYLLGAVRDEVSDLTGAEEALYRAADEAEASRHDEVAVRARTLLVWVVGYERGRHEVGDALVRTARAAVLRVGERPDLAAPLENHAGTLLWAEGNYAAARARHDRARSLWEASVGHERPEVADSLNNRALALWNEGSLDGALAAHEEALALRTKLLGGGHPSVASSYNNIGLVEQDLGRYGDAAEHHKRAVSIQEAVHGADHPLVASALNNLGLAQLGLGEGERAVASLSRSLAIRQKARGEAHPDVANSLVNLATAYLALGRASEALAAIEGAHARQSKALGASHPALVETLVVYADALLAVGRREGARARAREAVALSEAKLQAGHPLAVLARVSEGRALLSLGQAALAASCFRAALEHKDELRDPLPVGEAALGLAMASPRAAAPAELDLARTKLRAAGPRGRRRLAELEEWARRP